MAHGSWFPGEGWGLVTRCFSPKIDEMIKSPNEWVRSHGLVVNREDLQPRGRGFKSWGRILGVM